MKINPEANWNLKEDLALKFGNTLTAAYEYGFTEETHRVGEFLFTERTPKYWRNKQGQLISNKDKEKKEPKFVSPALSSYKLIMFDFKDGSTY